MTRPELQVAMEALRSSELPLRDRRRLVDMIESKFGAFIEVLDPLRQQERVVLRLKARELKGLDGESWAIGEAIERACWMFDALDHRSSM